MLDKLKKAVGVAAPATLTVEVIKATTEYKTLFSDHETLFAANASLEAELTTLKEKLTNTETALTEANSVVEEISKAKATVEADAKAVKLTARRAAVAATIGDAQAEAFVTATEKLDDVAFEAVSQALTGGKAAEADTTLFTEVGVDSQVDATKTPNAESPEMKTLKAKYKAIAK